MEKIVAEWAAEIHEHLGFADAAEVRFRMIEAGCHYPDPNRPDAYVELQRARSMASTRKQRELEMEQNQGLVKSDPDEKPLWKKLKEEKENRIPELPPTDEGMD